MSNGLTICVNYDNSNLRIYIRRVNYHSITVYCKKMSNYSTTYCKPCSLYVQTMAIYQCNFSDVFVFYHIYLPSQLYSTFRYNVIVYNFSTTEHYETLGQQDKPTAYDCIKNKEGKQYDIT